MLIETGSGNLVASVNCIVATLQSELDKLLQQKAINKLRIRNLRRRLISLQTGSSRPHAARSKYRRSQNAARRGEAVEQRRSHEVLRRACRIAFLELGGMATADELCAAIARRGSFSFALVKEDPTDAILRALTSMAHTKEVTRASKGTQAQWTYNAESSPFHWSP